jgi:hypothetical protein
MTKGIKKIMSFNEYDMERFEDVHHLINYVIGKLEEDNGKGLMSLNTGEVIPIDDLEKVLYTLSTLEENYSMEIIE